MKSRIGLCCVSLALAAPIAKAQITVTPGTPADSTFSTPKPASPNLGGTDLNFDGLTPYSSFPSYSSGGVTISSPDGLTVFPFSSQSAPNELFDSSADGSANITIALNQANDAIGFGVADSDGVDLTINALGASGNTLESFTEFLDPNAGPVNEPGNFYFVVSDSVSGLYGVQLMVAAPAGGGSGLAIDDVQVAPEPSSLALLATGLSSLAGFGAFRRFKQA